MELVDEDNINVGELAKEAGLSEKVTSARLSDLMRENLVERVIRGRYRILIAKVPQYLDKLASKIEIQNKK